MTSTLRIPTPPTFARGLATASSGRRLKKSCASLARRASRFCSKEYMTVKLAESSCPVARRLGFSARREPPASPQGNISVKYKGQEMEGFGSEVLNDTAPPFPATTLRVGKAAYLCCCSIILTLKRSTNISLHHDIIILLETRKEETVAFASVRIPWKKHCTPVEISDKARG